MSAVDFHGFVLSLQVSKELFALQKAKQQKSAVDRSRQLTRSLHKKTRIHLGKLMGRRLSAEIMHLGIERKCLDIVLSGVTHDTDTTTWFSGRTVSGVLMTVTPAPGGEVNKVEDKYADRLKRFAFVMVIEAQPVCHSGLCTYFRSAFYDGGAAGLGSGRGWMTDFSFDSKRLIHSSRPLNPRERENERNRPDLPHSPPPDVKAQENKVSLSSLLFISLKCKLLQSDKP